MRGYTHACVLASAMGSRAHAVHMAKRCTHTYRHAKAQTCCVVRGPLQINNGVYRSGFATTQGAYAAAQADLYGALDAVERRLSQHRFLVGDRCTALCLLMACAVHGPAPRCPR